MKFLLTTSFIGIIGLSPVLAQLDLPANPMVTPKKFTTRPIGGGVNPGAEVEPEKTAPPTVRYTTHIVLYPYRMWSSTEGKPLEAGLIAFEDLVAEAPKGSVEPVMPQPPANPTLIRDGKIRLLWMKPHNILHFIGPHFGNGSGQVQLLRDITQQSLVTGYYNCGCPFTGLNFQQRKFKG